MESSTRASSKAISQVQPTDTTSTNAQQDHQEQAPTPAAPQSQEEGVLPTININEEKRENKKEHAPNEGWKWLFRMYFVNWMKGHDHLSRSTTEKVSYYFRL